MRWRNRGGVYPKHIRAKEKSMNQQTYGDQTLDLLVSRAAKFDAPKGLQWAAMNRIWTPASQSLTPGPKNISLAFFFQYLPSWI